MAKTSVCVKAGVVGICLVPQYYGRGLYSYVIIIVNVNIHVHVMHRVGSVKKCTV